MRSPREGHIIKIEGALVADNIGLRPMGQDVTHHVTRTS